MSPTETARQISSDALERTNVTASLESGLTPGRNLICCAAFQLAWNQLIDEIVKAPVELEGNPPLVKALNKRCFDQRDVSEDCCLAMAGFGRDGVVEQVKVRLKDIPPMRPVGPVRPAPAEDLDFLVSQGIV